jgi:hypothetical protein
MQLVERCAKENLSCTSTLVDRVQAYNLQYLLEIHAS